MAEVPKTPTGTSPGSTQTVRDARVVLANRAARVSSTAQRDVAEVLQLVEERIDVAKRRTLTGIVRVSTMVESVEEIAEAELDSYRVEVTRVPVGRVVDVAPIARAEGDTTIIPVVEERLVLVKQLFLVEELHVRHVVERMTVAEPVMLRRQRAVVERLDDRGEPGGLEASADAPLTEP